MADASRIARTHDHLRQPKPAKKSRLSRDVVALALKHLPDETFERLAADPEVAEAFFGELEAVLAKPAPALLDRETLMLDRSERRLARIDKTEQGTRVRTAHAAHLAAVKAVEAHDATVHRIRDELRDAEAKRAWIVKASGDAAAKAMLAGESPPGNSAGRRKVERLGERIAAAEAALDLAAPERDALVAAERAAHVALCDEVNDLVAAGVQNDMQAVRKQFARLAPMLASLWAGDIVREKLIGSKWSFDHSRVRPVSGAIVVKNFLAGIAEDLRPPELEEAAIETAAEALAEKEVIQ